MVFLIILIFILSRNSLTLTHIRAHTGNNDPHSYGNSQADKLANLAINF